MTEKTPCFYYKHKLIRKIRLLFLEII